MRLVILSMTKLYLLSGIILAFIAIAGVALAVFQVMFEGDKEEKKKYEYKRRNFVMTRAEHECFDALTRAVGNDYLIFAQVHLPTLIDNKVVGQNWKAAFRLWTLYCVIKLILRRNLLLSWMTKPTNAQNVRSETEKWSAFYKVQVCHYCVWRIEGALTPVTSHGA